MTWVYHGPAPVRSTGGTPQPMGNAPTTPADVIGFGEFEVDLRSGELRRSGVRIALQEQPFRVLARLLQHAGQPVSREELRHDLWPENTFVDFEHGLNAAVKRLREALGDSAETPRFIETLPRRGYRFIAPATIRVSGPARREVGSAAPTVVRGPWVAVAALLVLAGVAAVMLWLWGTSGGPWAAGETPGGPADPRGRTVTVTAFENRSSDPALALLGEQIAGRLVGAIAQVPEVEAVVDTPISAARAGSVPGAGRRTLSAAPLQIVGTLFLDQERLEVQCRLLDAATGRLLHAFPPFTAPRATPDEAIAALERRVAGAVAIHFDEFFGGLTIVANPPVIDAYREYRTGLEIFAWEYPRAVAHLERALERDPQFWLPRVVMLFAYYNTGRPEKAREQLSTLNLGRERYSPAERLLVDFLNASQAWQGPEALRVLRDLETLAPESLLVNHNIVQHSVMQNRPHAAVEAYDRLPMDVRTLRHSIGAFRLQVLMHALHLLGEHERELKESRRAQLYAPGRLGFIQAEIQALAALGRLDELHAAVDRSLVIPALSGEHVGATRHGDVMEQSALALRGHGFREPSVALAARAAEWWRTRPDAMARAASSRAALGRTLYLAERWDEAEQVFTVLAAEQARNPEALGHLALCAARRGDAARARALSAGLQQFADPELPGRHTFWRARVAAVLGEQQQAVDLLREALAEGEVFGLRLYHLPDFDAVRGYAPFQELLRPKG